MATPSIVAGTDGSPTAERAVDHAARLALALGATLHVVNCYRDAPATSWMAAANGFAVGEAFSEDEAKAEAEKIVRSSLERLAAQGVETEGHVCGGDPADALMSVASDQEAEMIVVGNRGMSGARRMLGSVPNRVSHHARCGVLIVPTS